MTDLRPIETRYNGCLFRSRLEARWGVLFDAVGFAWEYEKEGFHLRTGERYLPDFWLPKPQVWVEVKGPEPNEREQRVAQLLADGSQRPVAIVNGEWTAWDDDMTVGQMFWPDRASRGGSARNRATLFHCEHCDNADIRSLHDDDWHCLWCGEFWVPLTSRRLRRAIDAARTARFEYGDRRRGPELIATLIPRARAKDPKICMKCQASFPTGRRMCDACRAEADGTLEDWLPDPPTSTDPTHCAPHR